MIKKINEALEYFKGFYTNEDDFSQKKFKGYCSDYDHFLEFFFDDELKNTIEEYLKSPFYKGICDYETFEEYIFSEWKKEEVFLESVNNG